jgi:Tfp pilus assembly protein PilV
MSIHMIHFCCADSTVAHENWRIAAWKSLCLKVSDSNDMLAQVAYFGGGLLK